MNARVRSSELRSVLERLMPPLYRFCLHLARDPHLAEDLAQDTMLKAWTHRRRLRDEHGATPWLFTIARNSWIDDRRRERIRGRSARRLADLANQDLAPPDAGLSRDDEVAAVLAAMDALPERQRDVLFLSALEGLSNAQIGTVLSISSGAVKASLSLARQRVADAVDNRSSESPSRAEVGL